MCAIKAVRNAVMNSSKVCNTAASELPLRAILLERRIICGRPGDIGAPERRLGAGAAGDGGQERGAAAGAGARGGRAPPRRAGRRRHRRAAAPRCCASPATAVHRAAVLAHPCCDCSAPPSRPGPCSSGSSCSRTSAEWTSWRRAASSCPNGRSPPSTSPASGLSSRFVRAGRRPREPYSAHSRAH